MTIPLVNTAIRMYELFNMTLVSISVYVNIAAPEVKC